MDFSSVAASGPIGAAFNGVVAEPQGRTVGRFTVNRERQEMRPGAFFFSGKWANEVRALGETGTGYTVVALVLADGRKFDQVLIDSGYVSRVRGLPDVPFSENDITEMKQTDAKWNWGESP